MSRSAAIACCLGHDAARPVAPAWFLFRSETQQISVAVNRRAYTGQAEAMPQAGLVRRNDGTSQVAFQRIENTHATKSGAGDQDAIGLPRAGRSNLPVQRFDRLLDAHRSEERRGGKEC